MMSYKDTSGTGKGVKPAASVPPGTPAEFVLDTLSLEAQVACALQVPWNTRQDVIMQSSEARRLIQALPSEEVFWMVKQRGIEDSLPLIARTSHEQFQYLVDLDCWKHDQLVPDACLAWYRILGRCNQSKVLEWFQQADDCLLVAGLKQFVHVYKIEEESDISEEYDAMPSCTIDGINYLRFTTEDAQLVLLPLLRVLYAHDAGRYQSLIEGIIWDSRVEAEDEALRWRLNRTAENGFPLFDEALALYQPCDPQEMEQPAAVSSGLQRHQHPQTLSPDQMRYAIAGNGMPVFLQKVLGAPCDCALPSEFEQQFVATANKVMVADCREVNELDDVRRSLRKTAGYLAIGLEHLCNGDPVAARAQLACHHPQQLFRCGYSLINAVAERVRRHSGHVWTSDGARFSALYGTPLADTALGLSRSRPLFFEGLVSHGSSMYRDFETLAEVEAAGDAVSRLITADRLLFEWAGFDITTLQKAYIRSGAIGDPAELSMHSLLATLIVARSLDLDRPVPFLEAGDLQEFASRFTATVAADRVDLFAGQAAALLTADMARPIVDERVLRDLVRDCLAPLFELLEADGISSTDPLYREAVLVQPA